jgi:hypothetical protein
MATEAAKVDENGSLYERDPYAWALEQSRSLRERRAAALDWDNLAEEVEDLAGRHEDALQSNYEVLLEHLAKLAHARESVGAANSRLWQMHARNARLRILKLLKKKPGLHAVDRQLFADAWPYARNTALGALGVGDEAIPEQCPWSLDQLYDEGFWPASGSSAQPSRGRRGERR